MRRIPRPSRAIDAPVPLHASVRRRISPSPCTHLRTSAAAFSTTPSNAFLLPGKQDKKKHQQFVRRWQKRLLGDSEPIGAHVDPYDPTSPVRIAPEEQGEYEEVLEEDSQRAAKSQSDQLRYLPVEELGMERPGVKLMHVGGEAWLDQRLEGDMAKEFEKLTGRTYTPLTIAMASEIEELTGTPYTLRDENLMLAQTVHEVTGRPYTRYDFGLHRKISRPEDVRSRFAQAVAEIYTLKEAGLDLDLAKFTNRGVYDSPRWIKDIKLYRTDNGGLALAFPAHKSAEQFIHVMQRAPAWELTEATGEDILVDEAADLLEPVLPQEPAPSMDPATPAFKQAAVVKIDPEKKPFDFMSNRPTPRTAPAETQVVEEVLEVEQSAPGPPTLAPLPLTDLTSAVEVSRSVVSELRHTVLEHKAQRLTDDIAALKKIARQSKALSEVSEVEEVKWRHVPVTDPALKFALFKRLFQLTGIRISDPHLSSAATLGDLYGHLCAAAKPQPTSLFATIHLEGQKARERTKQQASIQPFPRRRANLGDLINLGNVELRRVKPNKTEKRTKTGMDKVVQYALWERGLGPIVHQQRKPADTTLGAPTPVFGRSRSASYILEGTRAVPEFGKPLSSKAATLLAKKTRGRIESLETETLKNRA